MAFSKRTDRYYQLTAWQPEALPPGHVTWTGWDESTFWKVHSDHELLTKYILESGPGLDLGALAIDPDAYAKVKATAHKDKEIRLEELRTAEFPDLPSRRKCMFLCESKEQLLDFADKHNLITTGMQILVIEPILDLPTADELAKMGFGEEEFKALNQAAIHRANPNFLHTNIGGPRQDASLRQYWRGDETEASELTEVLYFGFFRVSEFVEL